MLKHIVVKVRPQAYVLVFVLLAETTCDKFDDLLHEMCAFSGMAFWCSGLALRCSLLPPRSSLVLITCGEGSWP